MSPIAFKFYSWRGAVYGFLTICIANSTFTFPFFLFQARIKKIMQMDDDVGKVAAPVPVIISKSLELFVEDLLANANAVIEDRGAR